MTVQWILRPNLLRSSIRMLVQAHAAYNVFLWVILCISIRFFVQSIGHLILMMLFEIEFVFNLQQDGNRHISFIKHQTRKCAELRAHICRINVLDCSAISLSIYAIQRILRLLINLTIQINGKLLNICYLDFRCENGRIIEI